MTRWLKHWQALPVQNKTGAAVCMVALIIIIVLLVCEISDLVASF